MTQAPAPKRAAIRANLLLPAAACLAGFLRAHSLPGSLDALFLLARAGESLARGSLEAYAIPPGGEGAPPLAALATWLGTSLGGGVEERLLRAGSVLLGIAAALLVRLLRSRHPSVALLACAFLVLPPSFASSFAARPDAALGGVLLLAALGARLRGEGSLRAVAWAWLGTLASPLVLPAAIALTATHPQPRGRSGPLWLVPAAIALLAALASLELGEGRRTEILAALLSSGWTRPLGAWRSTAHALGQVWVGALLLAAPAALLGLRRARAPERALLLPWGSSVLAALLFSEEGEMREAAAALAPASCLLLAILAERIPDPSARAEGAGLRRPLLLAFVVPILLLILTTGPDQRHRREMHAESARATQVAEFLRERLQREGDVASVRVGALAALSGRAVHRLRPGGSPDAEELKNRGVRIVVFLRAIRPEARAEWALFRNAKFFAHFAPLLFHRGRTHAIEDAVWVAREGTLAPFTLDPSYPELLRQGWRAHAVGATEAARVAFERAARLEPPPLGIAHEWAGILLDLQARAQEAEEAFREAAGRDPTAVRARGHLADRAISRGELARADSLLREALAFNRHEALLWGTRARLEHARGQPGAALRDLERAQEASPHNARILANHGILLWEKGRAEEARELWERAIRLDTRVLRYLGDFRSAPPGRAAPPMIPLFTLAEFAPGRPEGQEAPPGG